MTHACTTFRGPSQAMVEDDDYRRRCVECGRREASLGPCPHCGIRHTDQGTLTVRDPDDEIVGCGLGRIQRQRTKGWRMPKGAVYVGRPSKWGNPWPVGYEGDIQPWLALAVGETGDLAGRRRAAVKAYRAWMQGDVTTAIPTDGERPLRPDESSAGIEYTSGKVRRVADIVSGLGVMMLARHPIHIPPVPDIEPLRSATALACYCPLGEPCHADVLIELLS